MVQEARTVPRLIGDISKRICRWPLRRRARSGFSRFYDEWFTTFNQVFFLIRRGFQVARKLNTNPGQKANDGIHSITGGLNYYIHGDDIKLMVNYIHTWSDFRAAHPEFGDDQFDEVIARVQLMF